MKRRLESIIDPAAARWRDTALVEAAYDAERAYTLERTSTLEFDELVYGSADRFDAVGDADFVLVDDNVQWGSMRESRQFLVGHVERRIRDLVAPGGSVLEFGSGNGRNLLYLKSRLHDRQFAGLELSPISVELARRLSHQFEQPVQFEVGNACSAPPPELPARVDLVFSCHALEMMPRSFAGAIDNMLCTATRHVVFFEPIPELWPANARGWASHCRAYVMDRLRGFMTVLKSRAAETGWTIATAHRLKTSTNPINETVEVSLVRSGG